MIGSSILIIVIVLVLSINYRLLSFSRDIYPSYLKDVTDKSVNLTRAYQDEVALWNSHFYSSKTMANITEKYLPKFFTQLHLFNNTKAPDKYTFVKDNYIKSFENEIKSYQYFMTFLNTNNSTANKLSNNYLTNALNYETIARSAFINATKYNK
ncbi:MAG TPA: hypothetical protein VN704_02165 [Verrucomicrobiae bacterium]|nr:hypothetical protein [Verrucomicrobiae bacterium]